MRDKKHWWQWSRRTANADQSAATPEMFAALDRNADGYLTKDELPNANQKIESETAGDKTAEQTK